MKIRQRPYDAPSLVADWLRGSARASELYPGPPGEPDTYRAVVEARGEPHDRPARRRVAESLGGGGPDRADRLARFVDESGFVVTTGQQPVLFGGPLYALYKGLSAIALAARLEESLGRPVLPVFWIASEDHDWDEARRASLLDPENHLREVTLPERSGERPPLHRIVPGPSLGEALDSFLEYLPETDFSSGWTELLGAACTDEVTLPSAFARVIDGMLGERGLFHLQAHAPALKEDTAGLLLDELEASERSESMLRRGAEAVRERGYSLQVPILEGATNVFLEGPAGRERLVRNGGGYNLRRSGTSVGLADIRARVRDDPSVLSPNVLLRPVVESAFLPTLAYVGGPGEMAYLAQTGPLFELHGIPRPAVHPRLSADLLERKVEKVLDKHHLAPADLARPHHELAASVVREEVPDPIRQAIGSLRGELARGTRALGEAVSELDPTLGGTVEQVRSQGFKQLDEVERKVVQALKRENRTTLAQIEKAQIHLYPGGRPQERVLSPWYYLFRYGSGLLDRLAAEAEDAAERPTPVG